jgi:hypothetical protein
VNISSQGCQRVPNKYDNEVHPVPWVHQVRALLPEEPHGDDLHGALDREQNGKDAVGRVDDGVPDRLRAVQIALRVHFAVVSYREDSGVGQDQAEDELVEALPCDAPDQRLPEATALLEEAQRARRELAAPVTKQ